MTIRKHIILIISLLLCLGFMLKQLDHIHSAYVDDPLLTFSTQLEADNEIDVSEPVILAHCVITPAVPFEISYQEQSAHYMQPDTLAFLRPPKA